MAETSKRWEEYLRRLRADAERMKARMKAENFDAQWAELEAAANQPDPAQIRKRRARGLSDAAGSGRPFPAVLLIQPTRKPRGQPKIGASRIGGLPDLPPSIAWPTYRKKRLPFLAQLDLSELPKPARGKKGPLPADGWLYTFGLFDDAHDPAPLAVFVHRGAKSALKPAKPPADKEIWPDWSNQRVYTTVPITLKPRPSRDKTTLGDSYAPSPLAGWLFGEVFGGFGSAGEFADHAMKDGDDWINLLAIQSVGSMQWSDCGHLYLIIRRRDLAEGDFSNMLAEVCSS